MFEVHVIGIIMPALIPEFVHEANALKGPVHVSLVNATAPPVTEALTASQ